MNLWNISINAINALDSINTYFSGEFLLDDIVWPKYNILNNLQGPLCTNKYFLNFIEMIITIYT